MDKTVCSLLFSWWTTSTNDLTLQLITEKSTSSLDAHAGHTVDDIYDSHNSQGVKSRWGSVSNWVVVCFYTSIPSAQPGLLPVFFFPLLFFKKSQHKPGQSADVIYIYFSTGLFYHARFCEISWPWNNNCRICTANSRCVILCSGRII